MHCQCLRGLARQHQGNAEKGRVMENAKGRWERGGCLIGLSSFMTLRVTGQEVSKQCSHGVGVIGDPK